MLYEHRSGLCYPQLLNALFSENVVKKLRCYVWVVRVASATALSPLTLIELRLHLGFAPLLDKTSPEYDRVL